jgi:hypothetical protein
MSNISDEDTTNQVARVNQVIAAALVTGVLVFLTIAAMIDLGRAPAIAAGAGANANGQPGGRAGDLDQVLTWMAVVLAAALLPLSFVVSNFITAQNRRAIASGATSPPGRGGDAVSPTAQTDIRKLTMLYNNQFIVGEAVLEGGAFFAAVAFLLTKNPIPFGIALVLVACMIARFPTAGRVQRWCEIQQEKLREERSLAQSSY